LDLVSKFSPNFKIMSKNVILILTFVMVVVGISCSPNKPITIYVAGNASRMEVFAAQEVRKYIYQRTGDLFPIVNLKSGSAVEGRAILIGVAGSDLMKQTGYAFPKLGPDAFILKTLGSANKQQLLVSGGSPIGTLYAAYHLAEQLGIGFYLDGDVVPDQKIAFQFPELDILQTPLFARRGIQPFHDFPEGPDYWGINDYKAIFAQLPKLKMNFFGLHTYPENGVGPEPITWIGLPEDLNPDGTVKIAYHSHHFTTLNGTFGYQAMKTSDYSHGIGQLFDRDGYGSEYMRNRSPWPKPEDEINLFNEMGKFIAEGFTFAKNLGINTCIGTEIPLVLPKQFIELLKLRGLDPESPEVRQHIYEGIFTRIKNTHPLDFYWFWTNENWTWQGESKEELDKTVRDFNAATKALEIVKPGFQLATCGWVLGPKGDRALFDKYLPKTIAFSCINRNLGWEPVDSAFVRINDREKWAIPWMEDDPAMIIPQFWVGRMRRDAADAYAYGCNGYFGIHWRTRVLSMNVSALAKAAWEQPWNSEAGKRISTDQVQQYLKSKEGKDRKIRDEQNLDFYQNWCKIQFGEHVAEPMALLFNSLDGVKEKTIKLEAVLSKLPRPAKWMNGPGNILANTAPWDSVKTQYGFIDKMEQLRPKVSGKGNLERFDYWLNQFKYLKATGKLACSLGLYAKNVLLAKNMNETQKHAFAKETMLPIVKQQISDLRDVYFYLISATTTWGEVGNLTNWQQHVVPSQVKPCVSEVAKYTGDSSLVKELLVKSIDGVKKMIVPSPLTTLEDQKDYTVKVLTFNLKPQKISLFWRFLGEKDFRQIELAQTSDSYWLATIPASQVTDDFEYYISATDGEEFRFPASAPEINFAVVRL